ncbi:hypothetical protein M6B38_248550 [Iris pallida]|uniref:Uncharacterized protein n=1 Tax=Iris pallida TaxID=29817 RepID=A0AAX6DGN4_IRIPA|nr:hypothetical protein M6B38_248550 [Iris pallida]
MTRQQSHPSEKVERDEAEMSRRWRFFCDGSTRERRGQGALARRRESLW